MATDHHRSIGSASEMQRGIAIEQAHSRIIRQLHALLPKPCAGRPFVCDGFPELCDVIVIGENPVTQLRADWWDFWADNTGFDFKRFESLYEAQRTSQEKRPISNTRRRLRRLRDAGLKCLETNAFSNQGPGGHCAGVDNAIILQLFLRDLPSLKGVIAHGAVAQEFLSTQTLPSHVRSYLMRHFRSESYENIDAVAKEILRS